jgi:hypothetical protein
LVAVVWIFACCYRFFILLLPGDRSSNLVRIAALFAWLVPYGLLLNRVWSRARHAV